MRLALLLGLVVFAAADEVNAAAADADLAALEKELHEVRARLSSAEAARSSIEAQSAAAKSQADKALAEQRQAAAAAADRAKEAAAARQTAQEAATAAAATRKTAEREIEGLKARLVEAQAELTSLKSDLQRSQAALEPLRLELAATIDRRVGAGLQRLKQSILWAWGEVALTASPYLAKAREGADFALAEATAKAPKYASQAEEAAAAAHAALSASLSPAVERAAAISSDALAKVPPQLIERALAAKVEAAGAYATHLSPLLSQAAGAASKHAAAALELASPHVETAAEHVRRATETARECPALLSSPDALPPEKIAHSAAVALAVSATALGALWLLSALLGQTPRLLRLCLGGLLYAGWPAAAAAGYLACALLLLRLPWVCFGQGRRCGAKHLAGLVSLCAGLATATALFEKGGGRRKGDACAGSSCAASVSPARLVRPPIRAGATHPRRRPPICAGARPLPSRQAAAHLPTRVARRRCHRDGAISPRSRWWRPRLPTPPHSWRPCSQSRRRVRRGGGVEMGGDGGAQTSGTWDTSGDLGHVRHPSPAPFTPTSTSYGWRCFGGLVGAVCSDTASATRRARWASCGRSSSKRPSATNNASQGPGSGSYVVRASVV